MLTFLLCRDQFRPLWVLFVCGKSGSALESPRERSWDCQGPAASRRPQLPVPCGEGLLMLSKAGMRAEDEGQYGLTRLIRWNP